MTLNFTYSMDVPLVVAPPTENRTAIWELLFTNASGTTGANATTKLKIWNYFLARNTYLSILKLWTILMQSNVPKTKPKKSRSKVEFHQGWLKNVKLHNGFYVMSVQEFKRMAVIGYGSNLKMNPCAKVGGSSYYVLWKDYLQHYESMTYDGVKSIGIARQHWKIL